MSKKELLWFSLFVAGMGLLGVNDGWRGVLFNVGLGIVCWMFGRAVR